MVKYDLRELYHIHRVYEEKRRRIQQLSVKKARTAKKLMKKYSRRERNRARDFLQKLTTSIARELASRGYGAILESLNGIKDETLNGDEDFNRKISKWNCRDFQRMLEYKLRWYGLPVKYVNPAYTSSTCPLCSSRLIENNDRTMRCKKCGYTNDRDVTAAMNIWRRGISTILYAEPDRGITAATPNTSLTLGCGAPGVVLKGGEAPRNPVGAMNLNGAHPSPEPLDHLREVIISIRYASYGPRLSMDGTSG